MPPCFIRPSVGYLHLKQSKTGRSILGQQLVLTETPAAILKLRNCNQMSSNCVKHTRTHMRAHTHKTHACVHVHTCTHTHTHTHKHTHLFLPFDPSLFLSSLSPVYLFRSFFLCLLGRAQLTGIPGNLKNNTLKKLEHNAH